MIAERWRQIKDVLEAVLEMPDVERRAQYLDAACGDDADLRQDVESFLATAEADDDFFEDYISKDAVWNLPDEPENSYIGRTIGKYKICGELGAGGMGRVFLAERVGGEFEQQVALKFLRQGLDTPAAVRRFALERKILAKLHHPNIAQLIDGGTSVDGVPYLVMEYVEGVPLDDYCDKNALNLEQRLDLFRTICAAVSFAHRNLIVHRDLKPDNILVTADGTINCLISASPNLSQASAVSKRR